MKLLLIAVLVGLTACHSGWDQDPFSGQDENVRNAVKQGENKIKRPPVQSVMQIDVESTYVFKEGQKRIIPITYRPLHPDFKFLGLKIPNIESELPGATFDEKTGELVFEPEEGYVPSGGIVFSSILRISLFAEYEGLKQEVRKEVVFHVIRGSAEAPQVLSIDGIETSMIEGQIDDFKILVRDDVSPTGPIMVIQNPSSAFYNGGAQFVVLNRRGKPVVGAPGVWEFSANIDLSNASDVTSSSNAFRFTAQAYSFLGVPSNSKSVDFRVYTSAVTPEFTTENLDFTVGEKGKYNFTVYDPKKEGRLTTQFLTDCASLPGGAQCSCRTSSSLSRCSLEWTPTQAGSYPIEVESSNTVNKNLIYEQTVTAKKSFTVDVADVPGGV